MKEHFSRFLHARPERLHAAAHSHHPWPDVTYAAQQEAWLDAARLQDDKWDEVFGTLLPEIRARLASILRLPDPDTLAFAPNTHDLVVRIFSCLRPPVRVLTTASEFHSFERQSRRWEEAALAEVERVPTQPFEDFPERFAAAAARGGHHLVFVSQVLFDSGFVLEDLERLVRAVPDPETFVVVDGYHGFCAVPTSLDAVASRAFYLAGGYKYAMSGEGACFLHAPAGYGERPVDTGWFAGFGLLSEGEAGPVGYASDGSRFLGATFDPSGLYRMRAVLRWMETEGLTVERIRQHVLGLEEALLARIDPPGELLPPEGLPRGNFLTFRTPRAGSIRRRLADLDVVVDHRRDRLRVGLGVYHDESDVEELARRLAKATSGPFL